MAHPRSFRLWVPPVPGVCHWGRLNVAEKCYQFVCTQTRTKTTFSYYQEPFTRFYQSVLVNALRVDSLPFLEVRTMAESLLEKLLRQAGSSAKPQAAFDKAFAEKFPSIHELMTSVVGVDSAVRKTSSLLVFTEDGVWKGCLTERDLDISLWCSGAGFQPMMAAMEAKLVSDVVEWRKKSPKVVNRR